MFASDNEKLFVFMRTYILWKKILFFAAKVYPKWKSVNSLETRKKLYQGIFLEGKVSLRKFFFPFCPVNPKELQ